MSKIPVKNACVTGCVSDSSSHPMGDPRLSPPSPALLSDPCACPSSISFQTWTVIFCKICTFEQNYYQSD